MRRCRSSSPMAVIADAILLSERRPANYKRNVELDGHYGHFTVTRGKSTRPNPGALVRADDEQSGGREISRAIAVRNAEHRADNQFVGRKRPSGCGRALEEQFHEPGGDNGCGIESRDARRVDGADAGWLNASAWSRERGDRIGRAVL